MTSSVEQIKGVIDLSVLQNFTVDEMTAKSYAPIAMKNGVLFSIIKKDTDQSAVQASVAQVLKNRNVKFKQIPDNEFDELIDFIKLRLEKVAADAAAITFKTDDTDEEDEQESTDNQEVNTGEMPGGSTPPAPKKISVAPGEFASKKIGEILVEMGFISQEQLFNSLMEAKKEQTPLTALLVQRKFITNEQLKEALTAQQGYEAAADNELKISEDVLSMLPEDFIKMNKVLPLSYDDKGLVVGMV
ncbi:hypothetical protein IJ556_05070, partial [bacterium]|nr:hypothetical protein [bacterium]